MDLPKSKNFMTSKKLHNKIERRKKFINRMEIFFEESEAPILNERRHITGLDISEKSVIVIKELD